MRRKEMKENEADEGGIEGVGGEEEVRIKGK